MANAHSKVRIESFDVETNQNEELPKKLFLKTSGELLTPPELIVNSYTLQLTFKDAVVWPKIEKRINYLGVNFDTTLMAYQYEKDTVRVRVIFPEKIDKFKDGITFKVDGDKIYLEIPEFKSAVSINDLDENYLNKLIQEDEKNVPAKIEEKNQNSVPAFVEKVKQEAKSEPIVVPETDKKNVNLVKESSKVSLVGSDYAKQVVKFLIFTVLVLILFYVLVFVIKKTVLGRGRLAGLSNGQIVTVLGQNYIGPKRSLVTIKVNRQIFLLSNSENGIHFLSEITDTAGLIKEGEKIITGTNFDSEINKSSRKENLDEKVVLKSNLNESSEKITFSKQLKEKIKGLKPIHQ